MRRAAFFCLLRLPGSPLTTVSLLLAQRGHVIVAHARDHKPWISRRGGRSSRHYYNAYGTKPNALKAKAFKVYRLCSGARFSGSLTRDPCAFCWNTKVFQQKYALQQWLNFTKGAGSSGFCEIARPLPRGSTAGRLIQQTLLYRLPPGSASQKWPRSARGKDAGPPADQSPPAVLSPLRGKLIALC